MGVTNRYAVAEDIYANIKREFQIELIAMREVWTSLKGLPARFVIL